MYVITTEHISVKTVSLSTRCFYGALLWFIPVTSLPGLSVANDKFDGVLKIMVKAWSDAF